MLLNAFKKNQLQIFDGHRQLVIDSESFYFDGHYLCCSFYFNANHRFIVPILEMVDRAERGRGWVLGSLGCRARVNLDILLSAGGSDPQ